MAYFYLAIAIISEVIATNALKASDAFTKLVPSVIVVAGYGASFYLLSLALKSIPLGIAYAIWSGIGIVLISILAAVFFKQIPDLPAIIGIALIISGVVVIQVFSKLHRHLY
jgi:small multidrug resistance pump